MSPQESIQHELERAQTKLVEAVDHCRHMDHPRIADLGFRYVSYSPEELLKKIAEVELLLSLAKNKITVHYQARN